MAARRVRDRNAGGRLHLTPEDEARLAWWREARFGMFIHWGLYADTRRQVERREHIPGIGEWIMHTAGIPVAEYETLAAHGSTRPGSTPTPGLDSLRRPG